MTRRDRSIILIATSSAAFLYLVGTARNQFLTGDPTYYLGLAKALASGNGYTFMGMAHTQYPPGLPLLLTPFVRFFGSEPLVAQTVIALCGAVSIGVALIFTMRRCSRILAGMALILLGNSWYFAMATSGIRTELPFVICSFSVLAISVRLDSVEPSVRFRYVSIIAMSLLTICAVALRSIGVALPLALGLTALHKVSRQFGNPKQERSMTATGAPEAIAAVAGGLAFLSWMLWTAKDSNSRSYVDLLWLLNPHQPDLGTASLLDLAARMPGAFLVQITHYLELVSNLSWLKPLWASPGVVLVSVASVIGIARGFNRSQPLEAWYLICYVGIVLLWPFDEGARFLVPIFPLLIVTTYEGICVLASIFAKRIRSDPPFYLGITTVLSLLSAALVIYEGMAAGDLSRQNAAAAGLWLTLGLGTAVAILRTKIRPVSAGVVHRVGPVVAGAYLVCYLFIASTTLVPVALANTKGIDRGPNRRMAGAIAWLQQNADPGDVAMGEFASAIYFYTGLKSVPFPKTTNRDSLLTTIEASETRFLIINAPTEFPYYLPTEAERLDIIKVALGQRLRVAHEYSGGTIYVVIP